MLKSIFARHGILSLLFSDNGPQFNNRKFRDFARLWDFKHQTSSLMYPQSNKMIVTVDTAKSISNKTIYDGKDPYLALLEFRNSPISSEIKSLSELLMGRKIRGLLPVRNQKSDCNKLENVREKLINNQYLQKNVL